MRAKKLNKIIAALLSLSLLLSTAIPAMATTSPKVTQKDKSSGTGVVDDYGWETSGSANIVDVTSVQQTVTFSKTLENSQGKTLSEMEFAISGTTSKSNVLSLTEKPAAASTEKDYKIKIASATLSSDGTSESPATGVFTVTLPTYDAPGTYTYETFTEAEADPGYAGVTKDPETYQIKVYVRNKINNDNEITSGFEAEVVLLKTTGNGVALDKAVKAEGLTNTYESGSLEVTKNIKGTGADSTDYFPIQVTFTAPDGTTAGAYEDIVSTIVISGKNEHIGTVESSAKKQESISANWTNNTEANKATVVVWLTNGETVKFENIPEGVTWLVSELDASGNAVAQGSEKLTADDIEYDVAYAGKTANAEGTLSDIEIADTASSFGGTITNKNTDTATITNSNGIVINTGVILDNAPYLLTLGVVACGVVMMTLRRKREE